MAINEYGEDDGYAEYRNSWQAETRFLNCVLHYAELREGTVFSHITHQAFVIEGGEKEEVVLKGFLHGRKRLTKAGPPEVRIELDRDARTCSAVDFRWPWFGSYSETTVVTVPTDKKNIDKQAVKLLDAVQAYFAAIGGS